MTTEEDGRDSILSGRQIKTHLRCPRVYTNTHSVPVRIKHLLMLSDQFLLALQSGFSLNHRSIFPPLGSIYMLFLFICNVFVCVCVCMWWWWRGGGGGTACFPPFEDKERQLCLIWIHRGNLQLFGEKDGWMRHWWLDNNVCGENTCHVSW